VGNVGGVNRSTLVRIRVKIYGEAFHSKYSCGGH
jgi:hypothetical protein